MSDWMDVAAVEEIVPGDYKVVDVDDAMVAVINVAGEFYAIEDVCTHDGGVLTGGRILGGEIECPRHGARFCIKTGEVTAPPAYEPVDTFPIRIENGVVQVRDERWD